MPRRYPTLDLLRVVAVVMTMLVHTPSLTARIAGLHAIRGGLWLGVDLFMLISGWLLGGQLLREHAKGRLAVGRFYFKRWMRTLPPYYAMLLLLYAGHGAFFTESSGPGVLLKHVAFVQTYLPPNDYGVSWSLCVEEHFYLVLPLLVIALGTRARLPKLLAIVVFSEAIAIASRFLTLVPGAGAPDTTHMRDHGLFVGLLFAFLALERPDWWKRLGRHATALGVFGVAATLAVMASLPREMTPSTTSLWLRVLAPTVGTWTLACVFVACVHEDCAWSRVSFPGLQYLGELTYSLYLVHSVIPKTWMGGSVGVVGVVRRLGLSILGSVLLHHVVERPFLRARARILESMRRPRTATRVGV